MTRRRQPATTMTRTIRSTLSRLRSSQWMRHHTRRIDNDDVMWSRCGLWPIYRVDNSREWGVCFCAYSAIVQTEVVPWNVLTRSSQWQIAENRITRPSQWSDLLITDSGLSLPPPTTKNSGDGRMRRHSRHLELKTTRTCHWFGVSVCEDHSGVLLTCLQCAEGPGPSTVAALSAEAPNDSDTC